MQEKPKRRLTKRGRFVTGIAMGVTVAAAAVAVPQFMANAAAETLPLPEPATSAADLVDGPRNGIKTIRPDQLPAGAVRAKSEPAKPGARAKRFESPATGKTRVVGGQEVRSADHAGVVGIRTYFYVEEGNATQLYYSTCTGTVLSPTRVLTAAHCGVGLPYAYTQVIAGRDHLDNEQAGFVARVASTWIHGGYNEEAQGGGAAPVDDVSVLHLKDALPAQYTPTRLVAQGAADPEAGTAAFIVGYGLDETGADESVGILRAGAVKTAADTTCGSAAQWGGDFNGTKMLCAGKPADTTPAVDACHGDSGGPIFTGTGADRVQIGVTSWGDEECKSKFGVYMALNHYSGIVKAQITHTAPNSLDWTGDGFADLMFRVRGSGELLLGTGYGMVYGPTSTEYDRGFSDFQIMGTGNWSGFSKLFRVNNWNGDNRPSLFARDTAGRLWQYKGNDRGFFTGKAVQVGNGWNSFTDIMVTNNWTGNGRPNLMGRTADGKLILYTSDGKGGWSNPKGTQIGTGWNSFNTVLTPGSWLGDGRQSLIGRTPDGKLVLFNADGKGGWSGGRGTQIGTGWNGLPIFMSPGDFNGDTLVDMVGVRSNGELALYTTNGKGGWINGRGLVLGYGWNFVDAVF